MEGQKFNRLTAVTREKKDKHQRWLWRFRCECGNEIVALLSTVKSGHTKSCGCYKTERTKKRWADYRETVLDQYEVDANGCWIWSGSKNQDGYGNVGIKGKSERAHRAAYRKWKGPIPKGMVVMHTCDNPSCINPDHLQLGTQQENIEDMRVKGRRKGSNVGEDNAAAKVTADDVREIRSRYASESVSQQALADEYGITQTVVSQIILRRTWTHVDD